MQSRAILEMDSFAGGDSRGSYVLSVHDIFLCCTHKLMFLSCDLQVKNKRSTSSLDTVRKKFGQGNENWSCGAGSLPCCLSYVYAEAWAWAWAW